jgi:hypothetical protein
MGTYPIDCGCRFNLGPRLWGQDIFLEYDFGVRCYGENVTLEQIEYQSIPGDRAFWGKIQAAGKHHEFVPKILDLGFNQR